MTTSLFNISKYTRYNLSESTSDITVFIKDFSQRVKDQLKAEEENLHLCRFLSFADEFRHEREENWLDDNYDRFFRDTENDVLINLDYLSVCGHIFCIAFSSDGEYIVTGHSSGMVQALCVHSNRLRMILNLVGHTKMDAILEKHKSTLDEYYNNEKCQQKWYPMFYKPAPIKRHPEWILENYDKFFIGTRNMYAHSRWFVSEVGFIMALEYTPDGAFVVTGHSSGLIQLRHGSTGVVLCTLRNIQFPPKPIYALEFSKTDDRVCYAACMDGNVYRIEIPKIVSSVENPPAYCIRADPALESLKIQFYGGPGLSSYCTPVLAQRYPAQGLGISADDSRVVVGYGDTSIKIYDLESQEVVTTYKVHKLRLPFIPKKLQRIHSGQVCAVRTHHDRPSVFASAGWDKTARVWDVRCPVGCVMTFEGVDVISDSIDLNRNHLITGSWAPTEALCLFDIVARRRLAVIRAQNRRPDVDGEYVYACRYWRSDDYNRKGKYVIVGGSGTSCVEVINLHNRYITCSYPCLGNVLAIASHGNRIAFGGTATIFHIVKFHDPKHEGSKYEPYVEPDFDYTCKRGVTTYSDESEEEHETMNVELLENEQPEEKTGSDKKSDEKIDAEEKSETPVSEKKSQDDKPSVS